MTNIEKQGPARIPPEINGESERDLTGVENMESLCENTAEIIGGEVTPQDVSDIIEKSNEGKFIVHGTKDNSLFPKIDQGGIKPPYPRRRLCEFLDFWLKNVWPTIK
ncbi:hypothetical protein KKD19_03430 [Patescibacteria group bacterium]|nr:hypothetical protein [Patescibacteria group bacterium]